MARILPDTKFYVPRPRESLVPRASADERMNRGLRAKLTLISAPPGFGKTTLLAEWLAASDSDDRVPVWVSLDPTDDESSTFWSASRLRSIERFRPQETISMLQEAQSPPIETVVTTLANELGSVGTDVVLVLDDFHVIERAMSRTRCRSCSSTCRRPRTS